MMIFLLAGLMLSASQNQETLQTKQDTLTASERMGQSPHGKPILHAPNFIDSTLVPSSGTNKPYVQIMWPYGQGKTFNIYRSTKRTGPWKRLNKEPHPSDAHSYIDNRFPTNTIELFYRVTEIVASQESAPSPITTVRVVIH